LATDDGIKAVQDEAPKTKDPISSACSTTLARFLDSLDGDTHAAKYIKKHWDRLLQIGMSAVQEFRGEDEPTFIRGVPLGLVLRLRSRREDGGRVLVR